MKSMNHLLLRAALFAMLAFVSIAPAAAQKLLEIYPAVDSVIRYPTLEDSLVVICSKKVEQRYITFVGIQGHNEILLAAVTLKPIANVKKDISFTVQFNGTNPTTGTVETWGYVFDRNGDGKIDYLALQGGAAPVWDKDMPDNYPERNVGLNRHELDQQVGHSYLVFNHWADDNFDGKLDGVVHVDMFQNRDWVRRRLVVQSSKFNDNFDKITSFRKTPFDIKDSIEVYDDGVPYFPIGKETEEMIDKKMFDDMSSTLLLLNRVISVCKVEKKLRNVPRPELIYTGN